MRVTCNSSRSEGRASAQENRIRFRMPRFCAAPRYLPDIGIHIARDIRLAPRPRCKVAIRASAYAEGHVHVKLDWLMQGTPRSLLPVRRNDRNEGLLRNLHLADLLHPRLALLLLFEELL